MIHIVMTLLGAFIGMICSGIVNNDCLTWWPIIGGLIGLMISFGELDAIADIFD